MRRAAALLERLVPDTRDFASSLNNLGNLSWRRGELAKAAELHGRALGILEQLDPSGRMWRRTSRTWATLPSTAEVWQKVSGFIAAPCRFTSAERLGPRTRRRRSTTWQTAARRGDLITAEEYHLRSLAIRERVSPNSLAVASSLHNIGRLLSLRGDPTRAEDYYKRALDNRGNACRREASGCEDAEQPWTGGRGARRSRGGRDVFQARPGDQAVPPPRLRSPAC